MQLLTRPAQCSGHLGCRRDIKRSLNVLRATPEDGSEPPAAAPPPSIRLSDPVQTVVAGGRLPSRRRFVTGTATAAAVALGGNLGGVSSFLLGLDGGALAARLRLDVLVPVRGLKRCVDYTNGFEFSYPAAWLGDQTLVQRAAQRAEAARGLDPPSLAGGGARARRGQLDPVAAFGPAGSTGEENVSVICGPIAPGFKLESLGSPQEAALRFLNTTAAPPGSDKTAALLSAGERRDAAGTLYYTFEFTIERSGPSPFFRHNVSVLAARGNTLVTLNAQCPEARWGELGGKLRVAAETFRLFPVPARRR